MTILTTTTTPPPSTPPHTHTHTHTHRRVSILPSAQFFFGTVFTDVGFSTAVNRMAPCFSPIVGKAFLSFAPGQVFFLAFSLSKRQKLHALRGAETSRTSSAFSAACATKNSEGTTTFFCAAKLQ